MIETNLVGQYIVEGWDKNKHYHEIVSVYFYEGELMLLARNIENRLNKFMVCGSAIVTKNQRGKVE